MAVARIVLFAGCLSQPYNYDRYKNDLQRLTNIYIKLVGASTSTMTILHANGATAFTIEDNHVVGKVATKQSLSDTLTAIASELVHDDTLTFIASNHGGQTLQQPVESTLWCWNEEYLSVNEFEQLCAPIKASKQIFIFGQCYSGGFLPIANNNRLVMSASTPLEESWATSDLQYDEFLLRVAESIEGGAVNYAQVFSYAKDNDMQKKEHPQIADPGELARDASLLQRHA